MAISAAGRPAGKVSAVFTLTKDREGAYDFLESSRFSAADVGASAFRATARHAKGERVVYVPIDISSLTLTDEDNEKFGPIGSPNQPAQGVMVVSAFAVSMDGVPLGLLDQQYWQREETIMLSKTHRTSRNLRRPFEDKQGSRFTSAAANAIERLGDDVHPWVIIDREGDNRDIMLRLAEMRCAFTVRVTWNRELDDQPGRRLRDLLEHQPCLCTTEVPIPRNGQRAARTALLEVRAAKAKVLFERQRPTASRVGLELYAVLVRERGRSGKERAPLDWLLYTNVPVTTAAMALEVIAAYRARWRIEEFHRTWKKGGCNVETSQLRSREAIAKWATVLAVVATRIERLKYFSRHKPNEPASTELDAVETEALRIAYKSHLKKPDVKLPEMPTIKLAVEWIAEIGGWMGEKRSGRPGSVTVARGLDVLAIYTRALLDVRGQPAGAKRKRRK
jgi:hypothetical protein